MKKRTVYSNAKKLYSKLLCIYCDGHNDITDEEKEKMGEKCNPKNLLIKGQRFIESKKEEEIKSQLEKTCRKSKIKRKKTDKYLFDTSLPSTDDDSDEFIDMLPLESDEEEVKEGKGLKVLTSNKLLTRLPMLLAQVKAGNNSYKSKNERR